MGKTFNKIIEIINEKIINSKNISFLLYFWGLTFIFGSKLVSYELKYFTINPNIISVIVFTPLTLFKLKKTSFLNKIFSSIILGLLFYAFIWITLYGSNFESIFDIRSLLFYLVTFRILSFSFEFLGSTKFIEIIKFILWSYLVIFILFGLYEIYTGYHFEGGFTDKILHTGYTMVDYSPVFIFDNPNDYMMNLFLVIFSLMMIDDNLKKRHLIFYLLMGACFILSIYALARIGFIVIILSLLIVSIYYYSKKINEYLINNKRLLSFIFFCILITFVLLINNNMFYGKPKNDINAYLYNSTIVVKYPEYYEAIDALSLPIDEKRKVNTAINNQASNVGFNSVDIRLNLMKNGLYLIKNNPFLGVGPGQFQVKCKNKKVPFDIGTNSSPHNYIIEILSNYGMLGLIYFLFFVYLCFLTFRIKNSNDYIFWLLLALLIYGIVSFLPSAFLYQPMNWMFTSLWLIIFQLRKEQSMSKMK